MGRVDGRTALITGGSRGIGRAIALELAREGARVAINYSSNEAKAQEVADEINGAGGTCILVKANIGDAKEARAMVQTLPKSSRIWMCWSTTLASHGMRCFQR